MALPLTTDERTELERRASSRTIRAEDAKRAKVILMLADGTSYSTIEASLWCYRDYINRWRRRFVAGRLDGLRSAHKGRKPSVLTPALEVRILAKTQQRPPDGSTHWSTRKLARVLKIHHNHVQTTWTRARMQPHRFERYMQPEDPGFEPKATDVIGLYLNPPQHAAVFAADEKTAIQALDLWIRCCRCRPAAPSATASSTSGRARCRSSGCWLLVNQALGSGFGDSRIRDWSIRDSGSVIRDEGFSVCAEPPTP
jgi:transposase